MKKYKKAEPKKKQGNALQVESSCTGEPLRVCVRNAVDSYFNRLDGHTTSGLHQLVLGEVEAPLLEAVLNYTDGNQSKAAEVLGINRGTLRKKLREYDLS